MAKIQAGFGREIYSPDVPIRIRYEQYTNKILTDVMVTCVCLSDGENMTLIFSNDFRNFLQDFIDAVKELVSTGTGVPKDHIMITCTHNHSGPDVTYFQGDDIKDWWQRIGGPATLKAARDAIADLSDCTTVKSGKSHVENVTFVRRYFKEDNTFSSIEGSITPAPIARHETEADTELRALRFVREGKKDIVITNFQVHAATAAGVVKEYVCSDFLHKFRETVEASGDCLALYLQGGCGNLNTYSLVPGNTAACNTDFDRVGTLIGEGTLRALEEGTEHATDGPLWVRTEEYTGICNHSRDGEVEKARETMAEAGKMKFASAFEERAFYREHGFSSRRNANGVITKSKLPPTQQVPLSTVCFGNVGLTFTPFEMFDSNCVQVRECSPFDMTFTVGYTNGRHHYLPSAYAFSNQGYEPSECFYVPGTGETISLELLRQLNKAKKEL